MSNRTLTRRNLLTLLLAAPAIAQERKTSSHPAQECVPSEITSSDIGKDFTGQKIKIDGREFRNCTFQRCSIVYRGGMVILDSNKFIECSFDYEGPARRTLEFARAMNGSRRETQTMPGAPG